jgi:hypothetical protein
LVSALALARLATSTGHSASGRDAR